MSPAPGRPPAVPGRRPPPLLAFTQGDPAGIGPEVVAKAVLGGAGGTEQSSGERKKAGGQGRRSGLAAVEVSLASDEGFLPLVVAERAALEPLRGAIPGLGWDRLTFLGGPPTRAEVEAIVDGGALPVLDPVGEPRRLTFGESGPADAGGALAALDAGIGLARSGVADALVTAPVAKASIARHVAPGFVGHTGHLAAACGLERYGRDYLMAFLAPELQVALLSAHLPLRAALDAVTPEAILDALACLDRAAGGRIAVAGVDPHAGEGGLLGTDDAERVAPAVARARRRGLDVHGPESADSVFARARRGEFDWVLALYHDQGLVAVKTAAFGRATNWTLGLPFLRTSPDHGTAFGIAGRGEADAAPMRAVLETTLGLLSGELPRRRAAASGAPPGIRAGGDGRAGR